MKFASQPDSRVAPGKKFFKDFFRLFQFLFKSRTQNFGGTIGIFLFYIDFSGMGVSVFPQNQSLLTDGGDKPCRWKNVCDGKNRKARKSNQKSPLPTAREEGFFDINGKERKMVFLQDLFWEGQQPFRKRHFTRGEGYIGVSLWQRDGSYPPAYDEGKEEDIA